MKQSTIKELRTISITLLIAILASAGGTYAGFTSPIHQVQATTGLAITFTPSFTGTPAVNGCTVGKPCGYGTTSPASPTLDIAQIYFYNSTNTASMRITHVEKPTSANSL